MTASNTNERNETPTTTSSSSGSTRAILRRPTARSIAHEKFMSLPKEVRNVVAGGLAGMVAKTFVAPIDRIKILYQVSAVTFRLRNVPKAAVSIIREEGVTALWKGNLATMIRVFPYSGIQFMVFDRCKTYFLRKHEHDRMMIRKEMEEKKEMEEEERQRRLLQYPETRVDDDEDGSVRVAPTETKKNKWGLSPVESLLSGCVAGAVSVCATYPLDLTRAQLAVLKKKKKQSQGLQGFTKVLFGNYKRKGVVGLYRGITPTLLGILPYSGVAFTINEQAKRQIQHVAGREPTTVEKMQCGALAGLFAQTMTYPLEVTRRRMQTIGIVPTSGGEAAINEVVGETVQARNPAALAKYAVTPDHPPSMVATMGRLYNEQGLRGFFKGVSMNWMKGPIAFSISFTTFDIVQGFLETEDERALKTPKARHYATVDKNQ